MHVLGWIEMEADVGIGLVHVALEFSGVGVRMLD